MLENTHVRTPKKKIIIAGFCVSSAAMQVKYKGDLKKLHKPVTDMAESLSMQHSLSTSKLSSQVRPHHPPPNPSIHGWQSGLSAPPCGSS